MVERNVVLAIEPAKSVLFPSANSRDLLKQFVGPQGGISVVSIQADSESDHYFDPHTIAHHQLDQIIAKLRLGSHLSQQRQLYAISKSRDEIVSRLLQYAKSVNADAIAIPVRKRNFFGSFSNGHFANLLIAKSQLPIIILSTETPNDFSFSSRALYLTDFSEASIRDYDLFLSQFAKMKPQITLLHLSQLSPTTEQTSQRINELGYQWEKRAQNQGFEIEFLVDSRSPNTISAVARMMKLEEYGFVAMSSHQKSPRRRSLVNMTAEAAFGTRLSAWICGPNVHASNQN